MEQVPVMFGGTIRRNLTIGIDDLSDTQIRESCLEAQVWHELENVSNGEAAGLDADVGYRGKLLSGGQIQRLCLARCLARRRPLLLLDEPVSAQDAKTTKEISTSLSQLKDETDKPVTVLAITHNTDLLDSFSHAVMLVNGRVVECDTKEKLLARKGHFYRRMVSTVGLYVDEKGNAVITAERLRQVWLFSTAPTLSLQPVTKLFVTRFHTAGDTVIKQGDDADAMYVVVQGTVQLELDEDDGARKTRQIYQAGDDFGVSGLIDNKLRWPGTARVVSPRAMLILLFQSDVEELLEHDAGLAESFGELVNDIKRLRSPGRLQMFWPFFGATTAALELLSEAFEPETFDESMLLCDAPNDPCNNLNIVVVGSLTIMRTDGVVKKMGRGATFGEASILPRAEGSLEEVLQRKQNMVAMVRANAFSVVLRLPREKVLRLMAQEPDLCATYEDNIGRWVKAVRPSTLMQHWMFAGCNPTTLALLSDAWQPSVVQEGTDLIQGGPSVCVLVLAGSVLVRTHLDGFTKRRVDGSIEQGGIINSLGLIGAPGEYGESVVEAVVRVPTLVLTLDALTFKSTLGRLADDAIMAMRKIAAARKRLFSIGTIQAALPSFTDEQMQSIAIGATTQALAQGDMLLAKDGNDSTESDRSIRRARRVGKVADILHGAENWGLGDALFILVTGELNVEGTDGQPKTLAADAVVTTPLPAEVASEVGVIIKGVASVSPCIVLRLDLAMVMQSLSEEQALLQEQDERERMKAECVVMRKRLVAMENRLGLRLRREPKQLWQQAVTKIRVFIAFGIRIPSSIMDPQASGGSLEQELASLQTRMLELDQTSFERESTLRSLAARWAALQPPFLPEEGKLNFDPDAYDLSVGRMAESKAVVTKLELLRRVHRDQMIEDLKAEWERIDLSLDKQDEVLARATGIDTDSLQILANEQAKNDQAHITPMKNAQARLSELWTQLQVPEDLCQAYRWSPGMPLKGDAVARCQAEADRLDRWHNEVKSMLASAESARVVGKMLSTIHRETAQFFGAASAEELTATKELVGELQGQLRHTQRNLLKEQAKSKIAKRLQDEEQKRRSEEERAAYLKERRALEEKLDSERRAAERKLEEEEVRRREAEKKREEQVKKTSMMIKMDRAADQFREARLMDEKAETLRDTTEFEQLLSERRALLSQAEDWLAHLNCSPTILNEFQEKHNRQLRNVDIVKEDSERNRLIAALKTDLEELKQLLHRLELRADSDAVFVALKNLCQFNVWKPKKLAQMIISGPGAWKVDNLGANELEYKQLTYFLERRQIKVTKNGLAFFLQHVGLSSKKVENGKTRIDVEKFVNAFDEVPTWPLQI